MARIPPLKSAQSYTVMRGSYDVATKRPEYGAGRVAVPAHWGPNDMLGRGMEDLSLSVASPRTTPDAIVPPHPENYAKGQNGLDRALASLKHVPAEGSDAQGTQDTLDTPRGPGSDNVPSPAK